MRLVAAAVFEGKSSKPRDLSDEILPEKIIRIYYCGLGYSINIYEKKKFVEYDLL